MIQNGLLDYDLFVEEILRDAQNDNHEVEVVFNPFQNHFGHIYFDGYPSEFSTLYLLQGIKFNIAKLTELANEIPQYIGDPIGYAKYIYEENLYSLRDNELCHRLVPYYQKVFEYIEQHPELLDEELTIDLVERLGFHKDNDIIKN